MMRFKILRCCHTASWLKYFFFIDGAVMDVKKWGGKRLKFVFGKQWLHCDWWHGWGFYYFSISDDTLLLVVRRNASR